MYKCLCNVALQVIIDERLMVFQQHDGISVLMNSLNPQMVSMGVRIELV